MGLKVRFIIAIFLTSVFIVILNIPIGQLPPLGKFFDPVNGIWQNGLIRDIPKSNNITIRNLKQEVEIIFNDRGVPHIFAQNDYDLYFAAGYITAMHRLWQMEFTTYASMGRLSEVLGERAIEFDRYMRKMGMVYGAEKMLEASTSSDDVMTVLNAYSDGVNAWIKSLQHRHLPFEYKMLDYEPEPWSPIKTMALGMSINQTLSSGNNALRMSYLKAAWGGDAIAELFNTPTAFDEPIIGNTDWSFSPNIPQSPDDTFIPAFIFEDLLRERDPNIGSNNWAVTGKKSTTGDALLAIDPHLGLTLPSIWYEMQLNAPGINAYGVTFPGVPAIIMGFNESIAWGNTNTGNMVFDIFEIEMDTELKQYLHDGQWVPLKYRMEEYKIKGGKSIVDSIPFTHHGPVMYGAFEKPFSSNIPVGHAISWTGLETGDAIKPFLEINKASNFSQFRNALSFLNSPPQNYVFASLNGDIGMQLNGLWPLRWKHQGMFIADGRDSRYNWDGFIPFDQLPFELNPSRGFVSSANQRPTNTEYPYYYGWHFASPARISLINQTLNKTELVSINQMKDLQLNISNFWADQYLSQMTDSVLEYISINPENLKFDQLILVIDSLRHWDKTNYANSIDATIFEQWRTEVFRVLWQPLWEPISNVRQVRPALDISFAVLFHETPVEIYEKLFNELPRTGSLLTNSLITVLENLEAQHGPRNEKWQWWRMNGSTINHLLNIPALNQPRMQVGGSSESPNAISGTFGPSWRMVTQMSDPIKAWGIYPGGQTANPATKGYNAFLDDWAWGNYYELTLYNHSEEAKKLHTNIIRLKPKTTGQNKQKD